MPTSSQAAVLLAMLSISAYLPAALGEEVPSSIAGVRTADVASGDKMLVRKVYLEASREEVFQYMTDFASAPQWLHALKEVRVDNQRSQNGPSRVGVGTVRHCSMTGATCQETVVHYDYPNSFAYRMTEGHGLGLPLSEGTGFVTLEPTQSGGTLLHYYVIYDTKALHPASLLAPTMLGKQLGEGLGRVAQKFGGHRVK